MKIIVNATEHDWAHGTISYSDVCALAGKPVNSNYTCTYRDDALSGTLINGERTIVGARMIFNVVDTSRA